MTHHNTDALTVALDSLSTLTQAEDYLQQLRGLGRKANPEFVFGKSVEALLVPVTPSGLPVRDLMADVERLQSLRDALNEMWVNARAYPLPAGIPNSKEADRLWMKVGDYFGFDDSE